MRAHPDFVFKGEVITQVDTLHLLGVNFSLDLSGTENLIEEATSLHSNIQNRAVAQQPLATRKLKPHS
jgi:hypothetical protein